MNWWQNSLTDPLDCKTFGLVQGSMTTQLCSLLHALSLTHTILTISNVCKHMMLIFCYCLLHMLRRFKCVDLIHTTTTQWNIEPMLLTWALAFDWWMFSLCCQEPWRRMESRTSRESRRMGAWHQGPTPVPLQWIQCLCMRDRLYRLVCVCKKAQNPPHFIIMHLIVIITFYTVLISVYVQCYIQWK